MPATNDLPEIFLTDTAVALEGEDEFQRYPFAKQIATTIRTRRSTTSLVLGLYGKWGAGKTSVLNFIKTELASSNVITMVFNPWLFSGEEQLLLGFFAQLSELLAPLDSADAREAAQTLAGYGKKIVYRLALFKLEATQEQVQSFKSAEALEEFKHKLSELLRNSGKRILIIIDDLDRLDKEEIQAMLRLVKLTGDFEFTTYLLAFDDAMVARALGERYPGGGKKAGYRFLEKIIQVPLRLPIIQREAMNRYFMKHLQNSLTLSNTQLTEAELSRLNGAFSSSILSRDINPRDINRYTNTLMVALPMLRNEANAVDLILIEAIKLFYPESYKLAATKQSAITGILENNLLEAAHKRCDVIFGEKAANLGSARAIFFTLFPVLSKLYRERAFLFANEKNRTEDDLYRTKSIASAYYFKRYFSYAVQDGEIPDTSFNELLASIKEDRLAHACMLAEQMIARSNDSELLRRLDSETSQVDAAQAAAYCRLFVGISSKFSSSSLHESMFRLFPRVTGLLLLHYFKQVPEPEKLELSLYIIRTAAFGLAYQLLYDIYQVKPWEEISLQPDLEAALSFFTAERYQALARALISRVLNEAQGQPLYKAYEDGTRFLLVLWKFADGYDATNSYLQTQLNGTPEDLALFIRYMASYGRLNHEPTYNHLTEGNYHEISSLVDAQYVYQVAKNLIGDTPLLPYVNDIFNPPSDEERLHEYVYLHDSNADGSIEEATVVEE